MRPPLLVTLGLAALVLGGFGGTAGDLSELRVCGESGFDRGGARCRTDERSALRASSLYCSVRTSGREGERFTGRFVYRGRAFPVQSGKISGDGYVYTFLTIGGGPFPAGPWLCEVTAGSERASVAFTTAGPSGTLTSAAACLTRNTVQAGPVRACRRDEAAARPLPKTDALTCSAVYTLAAGRTARAEVLYEGKATGLSITARVPLPVSVFGVQVSKSGGLPTGTYACVFSLGGKRLVTKQFRVGA